MNKHIQNIILGVVVGCFVISQASIAHESVDPLHATPVEIVKSRTAYPAEVHVQETEQGVEIKGLIKRKLVHKKIYINGHVDVELLTSNGQVLESGIARLSSRASTAKHDHNRKFSIVLPIPAEKEYLVRVSHNRGSDTHFIP